MTVHVVTVLPVLKRYGWFGGRQQSVYRWSCTCGLRGDKDYPAPALAGIDGKAAHGVAVA